MNMSSKNMIMLGALPLSMIFILFYLIPLLILLVSSLYTDDVSAYLTFSNYYTVLTDQLYIEVLFETLLLALQSTVLAVAFSIPLAVFYVSAGRTARSVLIIFILLPLLTSTVVRTFAWLVILGREGAINASLNSLGLIDDPLSLIYTKGGLIVALAQIALPLVALPVINSALRMDTKLLDASRALGASRWRTFFQVILPLCTPGILAGSLLAFAFTATAFVTHTLVGGGRQIYMPLLIYQQSIGLQKWGFAAALSMVFMVAVIAIMGFADRLVRSRMRGVDE